MGEFFIVSAFAGALLLFFPLYVSINAFADATENKCWFCLNAYRKIKVLGGYAQIGKGGIAVHISRRKAFYVPYAKMADTRKKFEITKGFQLLRHHQVVETSGADSVYGVVVGTTLMTAANAVFSFLKTRYPFVSLRSNTLLTDQTALKVSFETEVVFNVFVVIVALSKKLLEGLLKWIKIKRLTASWKRRRSA